MTIEVKFTANADPAGTEAVMGMVATGESRVFADYSSGDLQTVVVLDLGGEGGEVHVVPGVFPPKLLDPDFVPLTDRVPSAVILPGGEYRQPLTIVNADDKHIAGRLVLQHVLNGS